MKVGRFVPQMFAMVCVLCAGTDHFRAVYPFEATEDAHLDLQPGDVVEVVEKGGDGWWRGYHGDIQGWFPASHLEPVYEGEQPWGGTVGILLL